LFNVHQFPFQKNVRPSPIIPKKRQREGNAANSSLDDSSEPPLKKRKPVNVVKDQFTRSKPKYNRSGDNKVLQSIKVSS